MNPCELTDGGLLLSVPTEDDVDRITQVCQDVQIQRWTTIPSPYRRCDAEEFVRGKVAGGWARGTPLVWAIRDRGDRRLHGMVGIGLAGDPEIGSWMGPEARGRGWTTPAARPAVRTAFEQGAGYLSRDPRGFGRHW